MGRSVTDEDLELFRAAVADVAPAPQPSRVVPMPPRVPPTPLQTLKDERQVLIESLHDDLPWDESTETEDSVSFVRPGLPRNVLRKLRNGFWVVQSELDLHGLRVDEAHGEIALFLAESRKHGLRCVRVIHGKGLRSRNREPVLKSKVRNWLRRRDEVLAFAEARPAAGGSGAVIVLLRSATAPR